MAHVEKSFLLTILFVPFCHSLNVCGLQDTPICSLGDTGCLQLLDKSLRHWFQTPEAEGYFIKPIDPLKLKEVSFDVKTKKFIFVNVTITGLVNSVIEVQSVAELKDIYREIFIHNLQVEASNYLVYDMKFRRTLNYGLPIIFSVSDVQTVNNVLHQKRIRCDGTDHLFLDPHSIQVIGGRSNIVSKNHTQDHEVLSQEFEEVFLGTVASLSTEHLYREKAQLFSIVNYGQVFKDN